MKNYVKLQYFQSSLCTAFLLLFMGVFEYFFSTVIIWFSSQSYKTFFTSFSDFCCLAWVFVTYRKKIIDNKMT